MTNLSLTALSRRSGRRCCPWHPALLLPLLLTGCATPMTFDTSNDAGPAAGTVPLRGDTSLPPPLDFALAPLDTVRIRILPVTAEDGAVVLEPNDVLRYEFTLKAGDYRILPGDELTVRFGADTKTELALVVRPDGRVTLSDLAEVVAAGKTPLELKASIDQAYRERMNTPAASVTVTKANTERVELSGEATVLADGTIVVPRLGPFAVAGNPPGKLEEALAGKASQHFGVPLAASLTRLPAAGTGLGLVGFDEVLTLSADGRIGLPEIGLIAASGRTVSALQSELQQAVARRYRNPLAVQVALQHSDSRVVYLDGEIARPGSYPLAPATTLLKALALAGGTRDTADLRTIMVIRRGSDNDVVVHFRNLRVLNQKAVRENDLYLLPQDVVLVAKSGVAKANLWVDQYISRMLPFSRNVSYSYNQGETAIAR